MCGIAGIIGNYKEPGTEILRHRGPDSHGRWKGVVAGKTVSLVHNRLSILDLSDAGNQPMTGDDGQHILVFNGEVYNYRDLKAQHFPGHNWKGHSDTEVLLKMLIRYGMDALPYLNGDFAFAFLDKNAGKLFLARDRFGIKPLYYHFGEKGLAFGSEIKALQDTGIALEFDATILPAFLTFKFVPSQDTLYKNVKRLPPSHFMEFDIDKGKPSFSRYWDIPDAGACRENYHDAAAKLRHLVDDAIHMRMISDVPVGSFLSGGLDSSIIASAIRERDDVTFYLAGKKEEDLRKEGSTSDAHYARLLAKDWGLRLDELTIGLEELNPGMLSKIISHSDDLIADGSQIPAWLISEAASRKSKVLLSGMGADEVFFGYNWHQLTRLDLRMRQLPGIISSPLSKRLASIQQGKGRFLAYRRYLHKLGKYFKYPEYRYGLYALVGDAENALSLLPGGRDIVMDIFKNAFSRNADPFEKIFHFDLDHFLVKNLTYTDRMAMAHSIEVRVPFLDHRVVEYAASLPSHWKLGPLGQPKHILKSAYTDVIPRPILRRRKAGFGMPLRSIFSEEKNVRELMNEKRLLELAPLDPEQVDHLIKNHIHGREDNSALIFALVMLSNL